MAELVYTVKGYLPLTRVWGCVEKIRAKQAAKPKHSPLAALSASRTAQAPQQEWLDLAARVQSYLGHGGLFNPELMDHDKVRGLVMDLQARIQVLETSVDYLRYLVDHPVKQDTKTEI